MDMIDGKSTGHLAAIIGLTMVVWLGGEFPLRAADSVSARDFERDVKPILRSRCVTCHGPLKQEGGLRLDAGALLLKGGDEGPVVVPSQSRQSRLLDRVSTTNTDERMPPKGAPLAEQEVAVLKAWIDAGAQVPPGEVIVPSPKDHWAFQPVKPVSVPAVKDPQWPRNFIDQFVLAKLEAQGWSPNPRATQSELMRRLYLDLTGLPPSPEEQRAFLNSTEGRGYDQLVERLLARPEYGERYARHWLDVVRYADSNGYERDAAKPEVWKYRDYVIRSLNSDLPFDRFLLEQVAGDELSDANDASMIATGFLRLGPWDDEPADIATDHYDQLDDLVNTTSQAFLALTMGCARCHDHKFDPLSQADYYGMVAVFHPLKRPQSGRTELTLPVATPAQRQTMTDEQKKAAPQGYFLEESAGNVPATHILVRGSPHQPAAEVPPSAPAVLLKHPLPLLPASEFSTQRRLSLAQWLASSENPLTARVIVNRVWQWHFGEGLVRTSNDFGLNGERPSHPELLDALAWWFVHDAKWSLKKLHALIVSSQTYQMSRGNREEYAAVDPENRLLWRRSMQRLEVEPIRDSILAVSGQLDRTMFGPPIYPLIPKEALESHADKSSIWPAYNEKAAARRTVYAFTKRSLMIPMLEVLDLCDTTRSSAKRTVTTVPTQALTLYNSEFVMQQAEHLAVRLEAEAGADLNAQIDLAWQLALCRLPGETERQTMREFVADEIAQLRAQGGAEAPDTQLQYAARVQLCRVLLNLNEFVYPN